MGNSWGNQGARKYADFLATVFGQPAVADATKGGVAVWHDFSNVRIFGLPVVFSRIMVKDESIYMPVPVPHFAFVYATLAVNVNAVIATDIPNLKVIYPGLWYDSNAGILGIRCGSLDMVITFMNLATMFLVGATDINTINQTNAASKNLAALYIGGVLQPSVLKSYYVSLQKNLVNLNLTAAQSSTVKQSKVTYSPMVTQGVYERFNPEAYNGYTSNIPLALALEAQRDRDFYTSPRPYGKAASPAVPLPDDLVERMTSHPRCQGNCAKARKEQMYKDRRRSEHFNNDPRWAAGAGAISYQIGSEVQDIDRTYGTVAQGVSYPQYADLMSYGLTKVPTQPVAQRVAVPNPNQGNFKGGATERFLSGSTATTTQLKANLKARKDPFLDALKG